MDLGSLVFGGEGI